MICFLKIIFQKYELQKKILNRSVIKKNFPKIYETIIFNEHKINKLKMHLKTYASLFKRVWIASLSQRSQYK